MIRTYVLLASVSVSALLAMATPADAQLGAMQNPPPQHLFNFDTPGHQSAMVMPVVLRHHHHRHRRHHADHH